MPNIFVDTDCQFQKNEEDKPCPYCYGRGFYWKQGYKYACRCLIPKKSTKQLSKINLPVYKKVKLLSECFVFVNKFKQNLRSTNNWLLLTGLSGTGKTTQACMIITELARRGFSGRYVEYQKILRELSTYRYANMKYNSRLEEIMSCDVLFIDDFLAFIPSADSFEEQIAVELIKTRYESGRAMIITMKYSVQEIDKKLPVHGSTIANRLLTRCGEWIIPCKIGRAHV